MTVKEAAKKIYSHFEEGAYNAIPAATFISYARTLELSSEKEIVTAAWVACKALSKQWTGDTKANTFCLKRNEREWMAEDLFKA